jgi:hypothetical protein
VVSQGRFANPRQLMAYLGLVPSEQFSGGSIRRGAITKAGNALARRVLIEGAWTYRMPARVSRKLRFDLDDDFVGIGCADEPLRIVHCSRRGGGAPWRATGYGAGMSGRYRSRNI